MAPFPKEILGECITLRCFTIENALELVTIINSNQAHLAEYLSWARNYPQTEEFQAEFIQKRIIEFEQGTDFVFGIFEKTSNQIIGAIGAHGRVGPKTMEIGYWMSRENCGKGYTKEAAKILSKAVFDHTHTEKIIIVNHIDNIASGKIPNSLGFQPMAFSELFPGRQVSLLADNRNETQTQLWKLERK